MRWPGSAARGSGSALAISLLGLAVLVTAGLSWEAFRSARSARATAEGVLRDYASFAAVQFGRESQARLEPQAAAGISAVRHRAEGHLGTMVRDTRDCECAAPAATQTLFALTAAGVVFNDGPALDASLVNMLVAELPTRRLPHQVIRLLDDGRVVVTGLARQSTQPMMIGFIAGPSLLTSVFDRVIADAALLPGTLVDARNTRQALTLRVVNGSGREAYRTDDQWSTLAGRGSFPATMFGDLHIEAAIKPAHASELVIGGLPSDRWPVVVGLLVLAAGLVTAAAVQLRREVRFARQRADFISGVSHELRTPLAQIRLFGETLQLGRVRSADEAQRAAQVIVQESRRLSQMVDNVLLFSRAGRRTAAVVREPIDAAALVADVVSAFKPQAAAKQMTVDLDIGDVPAHMLADANAVRQVLLNLLDNAVKYGPRGQRVHVGLQPTAGGLSLSVADEGPGVAAADRVRIWEPFWRGSGSAEGGTGLGLAIVHDLVHLHGGVVNVEPVRPTGAKFVAIFAAPAVPADDPIADAGPAARQPV